MTFQHQLNNRRIRKRIILIFEIQEIDKKVRYLKMNTTPHTFLKTLSLIHIALFSGLVLFALFAYFLNGNFTANWNQDDIFIYVVPTLAATGYFASQFLFRKQLLGINREEKLQTKLGKYQVASLVKYALLEGPAFLALLVYYGSGNALYLVIGISLIAYLFVQRPTANKIIKDIPLTLEEQKQFDTLGI